MVKVSFLEFLVRGIPEGLLFFLALHAFAKKNIKLEKYLLSSMIYCIYVYIIKFLSIKNGTYLILNVMMSIIIAIVINKIEIVEAIKACINTTILLLACEATNIFIIQFILKKDINEIFEHRILKFMYLTPSLILFACVSIFSYIKLVKRKELCRGYGKFTE